MQVVFARGHRVRLLKHIGTAGNLAQLENLKLLANQYLATSEKYPPLISGVFENTAVQSDLVSLANLSVSQTFHTFAHEILSMWYDKNGFGVMDNPILRDLVIMRMVEPASKLYTLSLLSEYFNITYPKNRVYAYLRQVPKLKEQVESLAFNYAKANFSLTCSLVFYDVTTLYFETAREDEEESGIRKHGFSKDNKAGQSQILIGLLVNREGYPLAYDIFPGNTFEGKTFIPTVLTLKQRLGLDDLTVVADAAMLSFANMEELNRQSLHYVVGARLANLPAATVTAISQCISATENRYYHASTPRGTLICDYRQTRAIKDKSDRKKQLQRAQFQIDHPSLVLKRSRFVTATATVPALNQELIVKDELLDGLKGYYTNLAGVSEDLIISRYKDLWHVEKSFRIAKSDLAARPIFHYKQDSIKAHILIVFMSLCLARSIELKTQLSTKKVKRLIWRIVDVELIDNLTGKRYPKRMELGDDPDLRRLIQNS